MRPMTLHLALALSFLASSVSAKVAPVSPPKTPPTPPAAEEPTPAPEAEEKPEDAPEEASPEAEDDAQTVESPSATEAPPTGDAPVEADAAAEAGSPVEDGAAEPPVAAEPSVAAEAPSAEDSKKEEASAPKDETPEPEKNAPQENQEPRSSASSNQKSAVREDYESAETNQLVEEPEGPKNLMLGVMLDLTAPFGNSGDFIGDIGFQGFSLDLRYYAWGNVAVGVGAAFDNLSKKTSGEVAWDNITYEGTQVRELSHTPIVAKGYYAWRDREKLIPYVAVGAGASRVVKSLRVGYSRLEEDGWHAGFAPELGIHLKAGSAVLTSNVRLHYLLGNGDTDSYVFGNFSFGVTVQ